MSALAELQYNLTEFWALPYHNNPALFAKLQAVQAWQRERILAIHQDQFGDPKFQPMADFLVGQLYGGDKFATLAKQLERMIKKGEKVEKFIPEQCFVHRRGRGE